MLIKRILTFTTLIVLLTAISVPSIDVSADKKSDNDKKKQAQEWLEEKFGKYKDYKKEQKENKKDAKEKREQDRKDAKEKREEYRKDAKQKRDDYKKEQKEKDDDDDDDDDYELGDKFNCKFTGGYYSPEDLPSGQSIVSIGIGECNAVSNPAISYGRLIVSDTLNDNDCYDVVSTSRSQSDTKGMKIFNGFTSQSTTIYIEITAEQCFQNRNGDKVTPTGVCGLRSYYLLTSTVDGTFTITNDAKGSGTFTSTVTNWVDRSGISYCDSEFPLGSLFQSEFNGSILLN
ncbi:MAG: hypothetical protein KJI69_05485 [Patescibacteria group bacterium]|nr:hypothetical protein [Patescibacteria group bacterium]